MEQNHSHPNECQQTEAMKEEKQHERLASSMINEEMNQKHPSRSNPTASNSIFDSQQKRQDQNNETLPLSARLSAFSRPSLSSLRFSMLQAQKERASSRKRQTLEQIPTVQFRPTSSTNENQYQPQNLNPIQEHNHLLEPHDELKQALPLHFRPASSINEKELKENHDQSQTVNPIPEAQNKIKQVSPPERKSEVIKQFVPIHFRPASSMNEPNMKPQEKPTQKEKDQRVQKHSRKAPTKQLRFQNKNDVIIAVKPDGSSKHQNNTENDPTDCEEILFEKSESSFDWSTIFLILKILVLCAFVAGACYHYGVKTNKDSNPSNGNKDKHVSFEGDSDDNLIHKTYTHNHNHK
jgi:hypothetical protein